MAHSLECVGGNSELGNTIPELQHLGRPPFLHRELLFQLRKWMDIKWNKQNSCLCKRSSTPFSFQAGQLTTIMRILGVGSVIELMKCEGIVDISSLHSLVETSKKDWGFGRFKTESPN